MQAADWLKFVSPFTPPVWWCLYRKGFAESEIFASASQVSVNLWLLTMKLTTFQTWRAKFWHFLVRYKDFCGCWAFSCRLKQDEIYYLIWKISRCFRTNVTHVHSCGFIVDVTHYRQNNLFSEMFSGLQLAIPNLMRALSCRSAKLTAALWFIRDFSWY